MARDLKLQVVLDAVNRATRPLKKITEGSEGTAKALRESREQLKTLERAQKDMRGFRDLKRQSDKTSRALGEQQQEIHDLTRQMNNAEGATVDLTRKRAAAIRQAKKLKDRYRDEQRQLHELRGSMTRVEGVTGSYSDQQRQLAERIRQANQQIQEQKQRLSEAARQQRRAADAANRYQRATGRASSMAGTGAAGIATGGAALYGGARMLAPGVDWGTQMSAVQAVGRFADDDPRLKALKQQSRDLGGSTAFSANEVGAGQEFLLRAGMSAKAIQSSMRDVLDLAIANNTELGRTADIASNIAGTFKIDLEQEGAMTRVADVLSATASRANVDLEKLGETVKYLGGADDLNLTLEQATTMAGLLGNVGIQGSQAGTTLRAMMNRLTEPTAEAAGVIDSLGIKVADAQGNMRAMPEILRDINDATREMGNVERKAALQKIFGAEAGSGLAELVSQMSTGKLDALLTEIQNATGENARMARTMEDNIGGDLKALNSAWQEVGITLTDTNEGPLRDLVQNITAITRAVGDWMKANPELTGQLATATVSIAALIAVGGALTLSLASVLGPVAAVRYGMTLLNIRAHGAGKGIKRLAGRFLPSLGAASETTTGKASRLRGAWLGVGRAWRKADPRRTTGAIKRLGKGVAALLGRLGETTRSVRSLSRSGFASLTATLGDATRAARHYVAVNGLLGTGMNLTRASLKGLWKLLAGGFTGALSGAAGALRLVGQSLLFVGRSALLNPIGLVITAIAGAALAIYKYWEPIKAFFAGFWQGLREGLAPIVTTLEPAFTALGAALSPLKPIWDGIVTVLGTAWDWVTKLLAPVESTSESLEGATSAGRRFGEALAGIINFIPNAIADFTEFGVNIVAGITTGISSAIGGLRDAIVNLATGAMSWFKDVLGINSPSRVFAEFGGNLIEGLINGLDEKWQLLKDKISNVAEGVVGWFKDKLGINSPSRVFAELGGHTMDGYQLGLQRREARPLRQLSEFGNRLKRAGAGLAIGTAASLPAEADMPIDNRPPLQATGGGDVHITIEGGINVHAAPGMDEQALARMVNAEVRRAIADAGHEAAARRRSSFHDID
ncbi:phage tail tape measure protein [Halomonas caseinilytica]|uniref:phage tail tape measure protein n=1 Tax=Halomonas caseinilytica TaxID=438744 RepID=UPI0007E5B48E|nr:phage tail tape measure protein [Halomonas caseinilytica]SEM53007.1 phage tail tape measure protein, TP901 family, core region [Halomonas caseinilytica]